MRKILITLVAALATLVPSAAHAAPRPLPTLTYNTTADYAGYLQTTATVSNLRFEQNPVLPARSVSATTCSFTGRSSTGPAPTSRP